MSYPNWYRSSEDGTWEIQLSAVPIVAPAPDMTDRHRWNEAWIATYGEHIFEVCVDVTNIVLEADDKNNCKPHKFTVQKRSAD